MERRLAAILTADVVGYSRLMGEDEAGTLARLEGLKADILDSLIAQHRGRLVKLMGDGFLVEFASVVDALSCALAWQEAVEVRASQVPKERAIRFRIGVNLGDVLVKGDDVYGDGVNMAARLQEVAEPGSVLVSRTVFNHAKGKVTAAFEDLGEHRLKNFAEPIRVYRVSQERDVDYVAVAAKSAPQFRRLPVIAVTVGLLVIAVGAAQWLKPWAPSEEPASVEAMAFPLPDKPSIAVLPFSNMSDDPNQDYFADGMTEDLITDLSKISGLFVISRNSSFSYKGQNVEVRQVAEDLGIRYVLEGSVRRAGDQVRVNAQLIDATTGGHLWADRYDGTISNIFALQDSVTRQIVDALAVSLTAEEKSKQRRPETADPRAYDAFLRGWEHYQKRTPEQYAKALKYFEKAIELDPDYGRAHAAMAWIYWNSSVIRGDWYPVIGLGREEVKERTQVSLQKAMQDPTPLAYQVASQVLMWRGRFDEAISEAEKAVSLDRNDADSHAALAEALIRGGRPEEALQNVDQARRLDPNNQAWQTYLHGLAQFGMDQFDAAASSFERAIELDPETFAPDPLYGWCSPCEPLAASYGHLGHSDDMQRMVETLQRYYSGYSIQAARYYWPYKKAADLERLLDGLRKAGVPE